MTRVERPCIRHVMGHSGGKGQMPVGALAVAPERQCDVTVVTREKS